jgi:trans-aconitate methyltransferase
MAEHIRHQAAQPTGVFGRWMGEIMALTNRPRNRWLVDQLDLRPQFHALEFGFGNGEVLTAFLERSANSTAVGIDWSDSMVAAAHARNADAIRAGRLTVRRGDITQVACAIGDGYDRIWSSNVIQIVPDRAEIFARLRPALKTGGVLATCFEPRGRDAPNPPDFALQLEQEQLAAGFTNVETRWMGDRQAFCVLAKR